MPINIEELEKQVKELSEKIKGIGIEAIEDIKKRLEITETRLKERDRIFKEYLAPDALEKEPQFIVFDFATDVATGDGKLYFHIGEVLNGMNLVYVHAEVITAGTTNTLDIQIHNLTDAADMLSTKLTVDSGETGSDTAATPAVIDKDNDDVAENDVIRIDVDAVHTTPAKGLIVTLGFRLP